MAGKPISHVYEARIADYGVAKILERVEAGETIKDIANSLGMSRGWLSTYLNQDPYGAEALALARAVAAHKRLVARREACRPADNREGHLHAVRLVAERLAAGLPLLPPSVAWRAAEENPFLHPHARLRISPASPPAVES